MAHEPKQPRPKRPINFWYDQNGPHLHPKRPTPKSKTAHESAALEAVKMRDGGRSARWMSVWKGLNHSPVLGSGCYPWEIFEKKGANQCKFGTFQGHQVIKSGTENRQNLPPLQCRIGSTVPAMTKTAHQLKRPIMCHTVDCC